MKNYYLFTVCIFSFLMVSCSKPIPKALKPYYIDLLDENELHKLYMQYSKMANKKSEEEYRKESGDFFYVLQNSYEKLWANSEFKIQFYNSYLNNIRKGKSSMQLHVIAIYAFIEYVRYGRKDLIEKLPPFKKSFWIQAKMNYFKMPVDEYILWLKKAVFASENNIGIINKLKLLHAIALFSKDYNLAIEVKEIELKRLNFQAGYDSYDPYVFIVSDIAKYSLNSKYISDKNRTQIINFYSFWIKKQKEIKKYYKIMPCLKKRIDCILLAMKKFNIKVTQKDVNSVIKPKTTLDVMIDRGYPEEVINKLRIQGYKTNAEIISK